MPKHTRYLNLRTAAAAVPQRRTEWRRDHGVAVVPLRCVDFTFRYPVCLGIHFHPAKEVAATELASTEVATPRVNPAEEETDLSAEAEYLEQEARKRKETKGKKEETKTKQKQK